jgi:type I restriction enzyme S subunit
MKKSWQTKPLGDVAEVGAGNSAPQDESLFKDGTYPFFRTADAGRVRFGDIYESTDYLNEKGIKGLRRYPKGTILFPKSGASTFLNHRVMLGVEGCVSSHLATIVADETQIEPRFLLYFLSTISAQDLVQDHAYPSLNLPTISGISIQAPPLPEQQRISSILDEAFAGIATAQANAEKNLQNAHALFKSHLQSIFTQRGKDWAEKTFEELIEDNVIGLTKNSREQGEDKALPYVKMNNITRDNRFDFSSFTCVDATDEEVSKFSLKDGDFLFNTRNSYELVGKSCIYESDSNDAVLFNNNIMRVRFKSGVDARFVLLAFSSKSVADELNSLKSGTTNVSAIYFKDLKSLVIPVPPIAAQKEIAAKLELLVAETQRLASFYERKLAALAALKKSLLHQAFTGEL